MRVACYARTSTTLQHPEAQLDRLSEYATRRGDEAIPFVDQCSGARARRPALDALLTAARRREIDAVAVVRLDRLARSVAHLTAVVDDLEALGVGLVVLDQSIDTATPSGRFLLHSLAAVAELERDLIRERVVDGMAAARRRGRHLGRPRALDRRGRQRLLRLRGSGRSLRECAEMLGVGLSTISRELSRS
jgi:DNA invertase Pin-like site-specific DNA recombinase